MDIVHASSCDTPQVFELLQEARFHNLPPYEEAKLILEDASAILVKIGDKVLIWASFFGCNELKLDLVISPDMPKNLITRNVSKYILEYGLNLSQNGRIVVECYNPKGVKAALSVGFKMTSDQDREGWVKLMLTREDYKRKFMARGKPV